MRKPIKKAPPPPPEFKKGALLVLKVPPYYTKCYLYEITSAGEQLVRASLFHSPKVKKSWSIDELKALIDHGIVRIATDQDIAELTGSTESAGSQVHQQPE